MDEKTLAAYLRRIGVPRPATVDAATLRTVHRAHQMTVPFENLSIHLSEPISLDSGALLDKIVTRRRGGFCYELNGAFALLLQALGADVTRVAARVHGDAGYGPPFDHLALVVRPADGRRGRGRALRRPAAVPDRAPRAQHGGLRPHLLVAADLTRVPLHAQHDLLAAHRGRESLDQGPFPDPDQRRITFRRADA